MSAFLRDGGMYLGVLIGLLLLAAGAGIMGVAIGAFVVVGFRALAWLIDLAS